MRDFTKLDVWRKSHELTLKIYAVTKTYPKEEIFGLSSQMRRSSSSTPTNVAEGCGRSTDPQIKHFFEIASGSNSELQYQIILSKDLQYISEYTFAELYDEAVRIGKMLFAFRNNM